MNLKANANSYQLFDATSGKPVTCPFQCNSSTDAGTVAATVQTLLGLGSTPTVGASSLAKAQGATFPVATGPTAVFLDRAQNLAVVGACPTGQGAEQLLATLFGVTLYTAAGYLTPGAQGAGGYPVGVTIATEGLP